MRQISLTISTKASLNTPFPRIAIGSGLSLERQLGTIPSPTASHCRRESVSEGMTAAPTGDPRERLRAHFATKQDSTQASDWESLWQQKVSPWDRGKPSPALTDYLSQNLELSPTTGASRKRALVPGCGRGYDVYLLSSFGYDAVGVDSSPTAVDEAKLVPHATGDFDEIYSTRNEELGRGKVDFIVADFFSPAMLPDTEESFDLIYDYTFLCALPVSLRTKWAERITALLKPVVGELVCLMFPLNKPPKTGGPPNGLSIKLYELLLGNIGSEIEYDSEGYAVRAKSSEDGVEYNKASQSLQNIAIREPERTHAAGEGHDRIGIWRKAEKGTI
ncbi:S-adenosyl-L-methionine-dependent methyltransferase [Polychaeton citri CBS 116435]|uniref:S-adenosyl-L-methionine-dependent methyltransferase n=1 Tax=Polychaeton citri CBS 116435 TaxID=1314669 RepID=A0A9P4Q313_9PEZI|nr:S-adenosyl-L-methionine-dependent methyltransferase [Polychaeton citri CBS 116435]